MKKIRPYQSYKEVYEAMKVHGYYIQYFDRMEYMLIIHITSDRIYVKDEKSFFYFKNADTINNYRIRWADGSPFGVECETGEEEVA